jgi:hypothetical protein
MENIIEACSNEAHKKIIYDLKPIQREGSLGKTLDTLEWYWLCTYKPSFKILFALALGILSILVVISETTLFMITKFSIFGMPISIQSGVIAL